MYVHFVAHPKAFRYCVTQCVLGYLRIKIYFGKGSVLNKKGRIIKNINSLNGYLQEINSKYRLKEFETSRMIDGKKKKFKHAWKLIK